MKENVVSIKDCLYIKDSLGWNLLSYKKLKSFENLTQDIDIKNKLNKVMIMHKENYDKLLILLKGTDN